MRNSDRKKAIRARMAATGEKYTTAMRAIERGDPAPGPAERQEITPARARELLAGRVPSRRIRPSQVAVLAAAMRRMAAGTERQKPFPVTLTPDGRLLNGGVICTAIAETGLTVAVLVTRREPRPLAAETGQEEAHA